MLSCLRGGGGVIWFFFGMGVGASVLKHTTIIYTVYERKCIVIETGLSLGILYSENRTHGIKDYTKRVSKHDDIFFNFIFIWLIAISTDC